MGIELLNNESPLSDGNNHSLILYSSAASPCVRRVKITLLEKGLDFDTVEVSLPNMEQRSPEYLSLNPNGFVPTLSHGEHVVFESSIINQYLEEQFPQTPLIPNDPYEEAQVAMWIDAEGQMAKLFRPIMYQRIQGPIQHISRTLQESLTILSHSSSDKFDREWQTKVWNLQVLTPEEEAQHEVDLLSWLDRVELALTQQNYLVGNRFSQADISLFPRIEMYSYLGIELDGIRFKNVLDWMKRLSERPSFEASMTDEAKKLRKMATSPLLPKIRKILNKTTRTIKDSIYLWAVGKVIRKMQNVRKMISPLYIPRTLPLPKKEKLDIVFNQLNSTTDQYKNKEQAVTLFGNEKSIHCLRIIMLLKQLNINYQISPINLKKKEQFKEEFIQLNPLSQIPVIQHGKNVIYDSATIAQYLVKIFDDNNHWLPNDSGKRSSLRMWLALETGTHKEFKPFYDTYVLKVKSPQRHIVNAAESINRINQKLSILDTQLTSNHYLCGERITYADLAWYTRIESLNTVPAFTINKFPSIKLWLNRVNDKLAEKNGEFYVH